MRFPVLILLLLSMAPVFSLSQEESAPAKAGPEAAGPKAIRATPEAAARWSSDYRAAVDQARAEGKLLLLLFTGTGWIEIADAFAGRIADTPVFVDAVTDDFVLVKLDYPQDNRLPKESAVMLQLLRDAYRVRGYPTVVITDPDGRPYALNGFQPVAAEEYTAQILAMAELAREKEALRTEAGTLEGIARAEKLVESIPDLPGGLAARYFGGEMAEVVRLDPDGLLDESGHFRRLLADVAYANEMQNLAKNVEWGKMLTLTDQYIAEFELEGLALQKALLNKAGVLRQQGDLAGLAGTLLSIVEIDPENRYGRDAQTQLDQLRAEKLEEELVPE